MNKTPKRISVGQILDKQDSQKTYNESQEGLLYNNQDLGIRVQVEGADREILTDTQTQDISNKTISLSTLVSPSINSPQVSDGTFANSVLNSPTINSASINVPVLSGGNLSLTTLESSSVNACTLSGSTINVDNNTLSNVEVDNFKSGVLNTSLSGGATDIQVPSAKAAKDYADSVSGAVNTALGNHLSDTVDAHLGTAIGNTPSGNLSATTVQAALNELQSDVDTRELASNKGAANGYCPLGADSKVSATYLPSYVDDVVEVANYAALPGTGETGKIYVTLDTNLTYRWTGSVYAEISQSLALGETSTTAYRGDRGATAYSHSQATSGTHGITGSFVGTTDAQVITNKDIDGGVAANTRRITFPSDTLTNLNALTRKEGTVVYATDTDKLYYDNGSILTAVGSGSGSGDLATYAQLKSDDDTGTWSTGNNATFLGGGSIQGTFTKQNATNPLNGTYSYTLVQAAGSLNDYIASDVQAVPLRSRGVTNSTDLVYTYDGSDNDIKWVVHDVTNATVVTPVTAYVKASSVGKIAQLVYDLPVTCTQVRFGAQVVVANSGKTLKFDDVQLATWTPQAVNLVEQESVRYGGYSSGTSAGIKYKTKDTSLSNNRNVISDDNSGSLTKYTILKTCNFNAYASSSISSGTTQLFIQHFNSAGTLLELSDQASASVAADKSVSMSGRANVGDYFTVHTSTAPADSYTNTTFGLSCSSTSNNVVQAWQDGMSSWSATSTIQIGATTTAPTKGTTDLDQVKWIKRGESAEFWYQYNQTAVGTAGSGDYLLTLPNGLQFKSDTTFYTTIEGGADAWTTKNTIPAGALSATGGYMYSLYVLPYNATQFRIGMIGGLQGSNSSVGVLGSGFQGLGTTALSISLKFSAPIQGWSSTPTLLALPTSKENVFSAQISSTGTLVSTSSDWISSVVKNSTGNYTINFKSGIFTVAPGIGCIGATGQTDWDSISSSSVNIIVSNSSGVATDGAFSVIVQKQSPDYTSPGVFVGSLSGQWQYDISSYVTSSPSVSSMGRAVAVVTKCDSGQYRMKFNISFTVASGSRNGATITISNCIFKNATNYYQAISGVHSSGSTSSCTGFASSNTGDIVLSHPTTTTTVYGASGDVELESKPTWATMTS